MRCLSTSQGNGPKRKHYIPDGQHVALCGFMPSFGASWRPAQRNARMCTVCHQARKANSGINYARDVALKVNGK